MKPEFCNDKADRFDRTIFKILCEHRERYNAPSTLEQAQIALQKVALDDSAYAKATEQLENIYEPQPPRQFEWLKDKVIEYVRERLYNIAQDAAENAREKRKDPRPHIEAALEALDFTIDETPGLDLDLDPEAIFNRFNKVLVCRRILGFRWRFLTGGLSINRDCGHKASVSIA